MLSKVLWILIPVVILFMFLVYWISVRNIKVKQNLFGWGCIEGDCEKVLGGEYSTYEQCKLKCTSCKKKEKKKD